MDEHVNVGLALLAQGHQDIVLIQVDLEDLNEKVVKQSQMVGQSTPSHNHPLVVVVVKVKLRKVVHPHHQVVAQVAKKGKVLLVKGMEGLKASNDDREESGSSGGGGH